MAEEIKDKQDQPIAFKAEIKQLLNILVHSLYTERDIFLRELISNASDALTQMHFIMLTDREILDPESQLGIHLEVDEDKKLISIEDTGVGMNRDEIVDNLGTIARSGVQTFLEQIEQEDADFSEIIGKFGVGFYSVFMVAEWVRVISRSYRPDDEAVSWYATGSDTYTLTQAQKDTRGTKIEVKLNEDAEEFANESRLREIIKLHSDFVPYPITIGDDEEQVNRQTAIWRQSPREVEEEEYEEFYRHLTMDLEPPLEEIHLVTDAPLRVYALLFLPSKAERNIFSPRQDDGLKLYARKVLIQEYNKDLLPQYFRFIQGVVDSEDIPLNISRESVQSTAMMVRLKKILTNHVTSKLKTLADKEPEKYITFWENFSQYIKEGVATQQNQDEREGLYPLLRFRTNAHPEKWSSLNDYVGRMKLGQKKIYYIMGDDERSISHSPHLDYFKVNSYEVLMFTDPMDSFMLMGLQKYEGYELLNVAAPDLDLPETKEDSGEEEPPDATPEKHFTGLIERFKEKLGDRVTDVRITGRLTNSVARLVDPEGSLGQEMQRVYRMMDRDYDVPKKILELNPKHPILVQMNEQSLQDELGDVIIEQIYENALLIEGLHPDPAGMISRIQKLIERALK